MEILRIYAGIFRKGFILSNDYKNGKYSVVCFFENKERKKLKNIYILNIDNDLINKHEDDLNQTNDFLRIDQAISYITTGLCRYENINMFPEIEHEVYEIALHKLDYLLCYSTNIPLIKKTILKWPNDLVKAPIALELFCEIESINRLWDKCARKIQQFWRKVIVNPEYKVCQNRLLKEFNALKSSL